MLSSIPIKYKEFLYRSIWLISCTLTCSTTLGQSGPGSNGNEEVHHIPQISRTTWFCFVGLYSISTTVGYLMPNPIYKYQIYDL